MADRALVVCNHPGGARAVLPVVEMMLRTRPRMSCELWLTEHSHALAEAVPGRVGKRLWSESVNEADPELLHIDDFRFVLTGTSIGGNLEPVVICKARAAGVPVFSILDHWGDYERRFHGDRGALTAVPDLVFVPDDGAREDLLRWGVAPDRLMVMGHPAFDHLADVRESFSEEVRWRVLGELGVSSLAGAVVFVSEPAAADHGYGDDRRSEAFVLRAVLGALHEMPEEERPALVVKLHPREPVGKFDGLLVEFPDVETIVAPLSMDRHQVLLASDLVLGIDSIMLLEAVALGLRAFSVTLGVAESASMCVRTGMVGYVSDSDELREVLRVGLRTRVAPVEAFMSPSSGRIANTILTRVGGHREPVVFER